MAEQAFTEFVKRKTAQEQDDIDWVKRKDDWLQELGNLFSSMERYLTTYTASGDIRIERSEVLLNEDYIGSYSADKLTFKIGREKIVANPIGTLLLGACGRVDLSGPRKKLKIVLFDKGGPSLNIEVEQGILTKVSSTSIVRGDVNKAGWYIESAPPYSVVIPFCKDSFQDAIMEVSGG